MKKYLILETKTKLYLDDKNNFTLFPGLAFKFDTAKDADTYMIGNNLDDRCEVVAKTFYKRELMNNLFETSGAEFSKCGKYRYKLFRIWNEDLPKAMCIGLNPSTANSEKNDATIRILINSLSKLGYGGFYMMNLFALISPKPQALLTCDDPIGENESKLKEVEVLCKDVIVCWGNFKNTEKRIKEVLPNYPNAKCFGFNANGTPWHPRAMVYIKDALKNVQLFNYSHSVVDNQ